MERSCADNCMNRADEIMQNVDKKINNVLMFWKKNHKNLLLEDAANIYSSAGDKYKCINLLQDSGGAYLKSANVYEQLSERFTEHQDDVWIRSSADQYINAANVYKTNDVQKTKQFLSHASKLYCNVLNYKRAAKINQDLGKIYEDEKDLNQAIKIYEKALEYYVVDNNSPVQKNIVRIKIADLAIINGDYKYGSEIYEELIKDAIHNSENILIKYYVKEYILKILLCNFINNINRYVEHVLIAENMRELIDEYCEQFQQFASSEEENLISKCVELYEDYDEEKIAEYLHNHKICATYNPIVAKLVSGVIKSISEKAKNALDDVIDLS
jgi:tetratricopeptide (TPR) repeat protein